ncbi:TonB-dependent receptor domain-containing protein [Sandarakinorhabdus sp.]|uniref:TonB-dependent receptor n=1 Tax=Sandarakinorhabdus sp. TaxID=1916663 RepID=UPI00286DE32C|nr:TonB-dependent receptor [Sandarakinorhabdus sp.]
MKTFLLATVAALTLPVAAQAQETTAQAAEVMEQGEIIVTATRRNEKLSDVPIAVSAVSMDQLRNSGAADIRQLNQLAPSLLVSSTGNEANGSARIRGVGTVGDNPGLESSVAVFIDGVYRSRSGIGLNELGELERIEVLRGPQGTLFGRNASAGLINIVSKKPDFEFGGNAEINYGNLDFWRLQGGITGPIFGDKAAFRIDGVYVKRDGFLTDVISGNKINNRDRFFVRGQLLLQPSDDLSIRLIGDFSHRREACCAASYLPSVGETFDPTAGAGNATTPGFNTDGAIAFRANPILNVLQSLGGVIGQGDPFARQVSVTPGRSYNNTTRDWGLSGEINYKFGDFNLTSITAYRRYKAGGAGDVDYNNVDILYRADDGTSFRQFNTFTQEVRLQASLFDDKLDFLVGGFFASEKLRVSDNIKFGNQYGAFASCRLITLISGSAALRDPTQPGCLTPTGTATLNGAFGGAAPLLISGLNRLSTVNNVGDNGTRYNQLSTNFAFFTHNVLHITDTLSVTGGLRWTREVKRFDASFNNTNTICGAQQAAFSNFLPGGSTAFPAALQGFTQAIVNLTCQGNNTSALNGLNLADRRVESELTGTAVVAWKPTDDWLAYASFSRGYKAGGFNLDRSALGLPIYAPTDPRNTVVNGAPFGTRNLQFDQELVDAYELGIKFSSRQFNVNVALFRQDFSNFQLNTFNGSVFLVQTVMGCKDDLGNAQRDTSPVTGSCAANRTKAGVRSEGIEIESTFFPSKDIMIGAGITYASTKYARNLVGNRSGAALDPALFRLPGQQLSNAPEIVATASFAWTPEINENLSALFYVDARHSDGYNTGSDLFVEKRQASFTLVNARIGIRGPDQKWALEFWAQNVFNQDFQQVAFNAPFQGGGSQAATILYGSTGNQLFGTFLGEPRTYGVTLRSFF